MDCPAILDACLIGDGSLKLLAISPKTIVCLATVVILDWIWHQGTIQASSHRIATLSTCSPPEKVNGLRSFIGAYKVLDHVIPNCASLLAPLDDATASHQSQERIEWSDDLRSVFLHSPVCTVV